MRVFYGIVLNDEAKNKIDSVQKELMQIAGKGKFIFKENFHITLRFMGEIDPSNVETYGRLLFDVTKDIGKFTLITDQVSSFSKGIKILPWIGLKESEELLSLHQDLQQVLKKNLSVEEEVFTPHITLGRDVELKSNLGSLQIEPFEIIVNRLALFESKNIDGKLQYLERAVVHLL